jgi:two-component system response regulator DesR
MEDDIDVIAELDELPRAIGDSRIDHPDVTVLDPDLLGPDGIDAAATAYAKLQNCKVLALVDPRWTGLRGVNLASQSARVGFLAQTGPPERVVDGIRRLARHETVLDADLVVAALQQPKGPLTPSEVRALRVAARGSPVNEIARKLGLSPGTVRNHLSRVIAKTGARTRIEAIHIARNSGWI